MAARGAREGPTLVVSAGVHGDEYEGIQAIFDVFEALDPARMRGNFIAVPIAHPPAYRAGTRTSPIDGANLARVFPGNPAGSATEEIAWYFDQRILALADLYLDLHSGGVKWAMPALVGYHEGDERAAAAAEAFGAPVIWRHPQIAPGRTVSAAKARNIPALYAEGRGGARVQPDDLYVQRRGISNLLRHLGILEGVLEEGPVPVRILGDGNIDDGLAAAQSGFLTAEVELLQEVVPGMVLGRLRDSWGRELATVVAPRGGVVVLIHSCPLIETGEPLFLLTDRLA